MTTKPFPAITGGCHCAAVRYRVLTAPMFCYACHCIDCQKDTGSAFALYAVIEAYNIKVISEAKPSQVISTPNRSNPAETCRHAICSQCGTILWGADHRWGYAVSNVRTGTLDFPGIMEPDMHSFVGSKLGWFDLPKHAKTSRGGFDYKVVWPKDSLQRLDVCLERFEAAKKALASRGVKTEDVARKKDESFVDGDGDKTPTASGDVDDGEDEEAFEKRFKETERLLQERLAKLSLKLEDDKKQGTDTEETPA